MLRAGNDISKGFPFGIYIQAENNLSEVRAESETNVSGPPVKMICSLMLDSHLESDSFMDHNIENYCQLLKMRTSNPCCGSLTGS